MMGEPKLQMRCLCLRGAFFAKPLQVSVSRWPGKLTQADLL